MMGVIVVGRLLVIVSQLESNVGLWCVVPLFSCPNPNYKKS